MYRKDKKFELIEIATEAARISDILMPLKDHRRVANNMSNVGFGVEHFFNPLAFVAYLQNQRRLYNG